MIADKESVPALLYDQHCYACSVAALALARLTRGYVELRPLSELQPGKARLGARLSVGGWNFSGLFVLAALLPYVLVGLVRPGSLPKGLSQVYSSGRCLFPCQGFRAIVLRLLSFVASTAITPGKEGAQPAHGLT